MTLDSASLDAVYDEELSEMSGSLPLMRSFGSSIPSIVLEDSVAAPAQAPPAPVPPPMRTAQSCCCNGEYSSPAKFGAVSASSSFGAAAPELGRAATFSSLFEQRLRELRLLLNDPGSPAARAALWGMGAKRRSDFPKFVESLRRIAGLGVGQFGTVSLVADRAGQTFALKALHKDHLVATGMVEAVKRERRLLARVHHPFVVRLERSFQNAHTIFLVMEPVLGGELYALLHLLGRLEEAHVAFYCACVTEALAHLHAMRVVYRDLKPENLLLDEVGYLKVVDFGLAKELGADGRTHTVCGTPEYLAPEVVRHEAYGFAVDWWSLGMLAFELLSGVPAFRGADKAEVYRRVREDEPRLLVPVGAGASALLAALLCKAPAERLGGGGGGAAAVRAHSFFGAVDWAALFAKKVPAPYVPTIAHATDTSNVLQIEKYASPAQEHDGARWAAHLDDGDPFERWDEISDESYC